MKLNAHYSVYFNLNAPLLKQHEKINQKFNTNDRLILILNSPNNSLFTPNKRKVAKRFITQLQTDKRIKHLTSYLDFLNKSFMTNNSVQISSKANAKTLLQNTQKHPRGKYLITSDGHYGLIILDVKLENKHNAKEIKQFIDSIKQLANISFNDHNIPITVHYTDIIAMNASYIDTVRHDLTLFIPIMLIVFIILLYFFTRNLKLSVSTLLVGFLAIICAIGLAGWLQLELAAITAFTPVIIMSLSIAISVHILNNTFQLKLTKKSTYQSVTTSLTYNFTALALSVLTTAFGFFLLAFSPSPPIQALGYIVAVGIIFAFLFNYIILSRILIRMNIKPKTFLFNKAHFLNQLIKIILKNNKKIITLFILLFIGSIVFVSQLKVNDNVFEYFPKNHSFRNDTQLLEQHFSGINKLDFFIDGKKDYAIFNKSLLKQLIAFRKWLKQQPEVLHVSSILDIKEALNLSLAQLKFRAQSYNPKEIKLDKEIYGLYQGMLLSVYLKPISSAEILAFSQRSNTYLKAHFSYAHSPAIGTSILFASLGKINAISMFWSLSIALVLVAVLLAIIKRSLLILFIGLFVNFFPILFVFSIWQIAGGFISLGSAVVMGMILGIVVDDTIHFLLKYQHRNQQPKIAITALINDVAPAVIITSITLIIGLLIGLLSDFRPISDMSILSAAIIFIALTTDIILLPALLFIFWRWLSHD
ncbi:MMPL family transporter [bacterium SCSIO 12844]|nr:MMPL family transporter [bacterium SCSIO 12844]